MLRVAVSAVLLLAACVARTSTAQSAPSQFEAASIHPTDAKEFGGPSGCATTTGLMRCTNVTLKHCITSAYRVGADRVVSGPAWIDSDRFQIVGRSDQPVGDKGLMEMLQTLLTDRFKLVLHRESRQREAMILEVAKNGSRLQPAEGAHSSYRNMHDHLEATRITMGDFAGILSRDLKLPVFDRTGLSGAFTFMLHWDPMDADSLSHDEVAIALRPEMARAIAQQLGLTLTSRKMPIDLLVIDHAEKPSDN